MKKFLVLLVVICTGLSFSQTKYLIYFKDKGIQPGERLAKSSAEFNDALNLLSEKSIQRRIKNMGEDNFITYEDVPLKSEYILELESLGIKIENRLKWFNAVSAYLTPNQLERINQLEFVIKTEPVKVLIFSNQPETTEQVVRKTSQDNFAFDYGPSLDQLELSEVPVVHSNGITGEGVLIGVLDSGFDWKNHESLDDAGVIAEYDFVQNDSSTANDSLDLSSQHNHGTLVFSILGGFKEGSLIGSSFGSDFILAKTEDIGSETHVEEDNYAQALEWMESFGVDVTSSSVGYNIFDPGTFSYTYEDMDGNTTIVTRAAELAFNRGIVTVTSAGNEGNSLWFYIIAPADGFNTLGIGAVTNSNDVAGFSSRGPSFDGRIKPDLVAQGEMVYGATAGNFSGYGFRNGTSVSAPIASGIAALLLSAHPHLKNTQVRNILFETADNSTSPDYERGYGLISALDAVQFPNLQDTLGTFVLHKIFIQPENINPQTVELHYSINGEDYITAPMEFDLNFGYTFRIPSLSGADLVNFFFRFSDLAGAGFRDPPSSSYRFYYGQLNISLNLESGLIPDDAIVSEPFPNPFNPEMHSLANIYIESSGGESLKIRIYNSIGQQVSTYNVLTRDGINKFVWDGTGDNGTEVASGAYYFVLELDGKKFDKGIILLR